MIKEFLILEELKKKVEQWKDDMNKMYTLSEIYKLEASLYEKDAEDMYKAIHNLRTASIYGPYKINKNTDETIG